MSLDGSRLLDGADSARQRLGDALRIRRGTYPWLRDYGSDLADLVDRNLDADFEARVYAGVAGTIAHPPNGLADIALREVRLRRDPETPARPEIEVFADWIAPDGSVGEIGLRQALAEPRPRAGALYAATEAGLFRIDTATGAAVRRGPARFGRGDAPAPGSLAWDGRRLWMTVRAPGRLFTVDPEDAALEAVPGPADFGVGEGRPTAAAWASWRLLMLGDDTDALWEIDRTTGVARRVHAIDRFGVGEHQPDGLAFDGWRLWMVAGINHALHRIDPVRGRAIRTGAAHRFGQDLDGGGELAWDGRRLLMLRAGTGTLYEIDRVTGAAAPVVRIDGPDWDAAGGLGGMTWIGEAA